jgi:hypothetical protein
MRCGADRAATTSAFFFLSAIYRNLYTIRGIRLTPIMIPMIVIPTGTSTSRLSVNVVVIGASIALVKVMKSTLLSPKIS